MRHSQDFDMEEYIRKRMLEIEQLKERELFKDVVGGILSKVYQYNQSSYQQLERRILNEYNMQQNDYAIYTSLTDRQHYDATDTFMYPMCLEAVKEIKLSWKDLEEVWKKGQKVKLDTVFLKAAASQINKLNMQERIFNGMVITNRGKYQAKVELKPNRSYLEEVKSLYAVFGVNFQPWSTVCTAYLSKMLDVYLVQMEPMKKDEEVLEIKVDFKEYSHQIYYGMIPLWNLKPIKQKTSTYPTSGIDKINYEHQIFFHQLKKECEYLIRNTDMEVINIRRLNGDLLITCPADEPCEWDLYQVQRYQGIERYPYPILSNCYKESFSAAIAEMFRKSVKTKGELARFIESYEYQHYVQFQDIHIEKEMPDNWPDTTYNMDAFIHDEIRTKSPSQVLVMDFSALNPNDYLNEDIMSFLVTQVQKLFAEYQCIGRIV